MRLHGFCTRRYLEEVCLPRVEEGLTAGGQQRTAFEVWGGGFIVTGPDEASLQRALEGIRYRIAFYGSTRTYSPVLSLHGLDDLAAELHRLSKAGKWGEMPGCVSDDVLQLFTASGTYETIASEIEKRFGDLVDVVAPGFPADAPEGLTRDLLQDIQRIPTPFSGYQTG